MLPARLHFYGNPTGGSKDAEFDKGRNDCNYQQERDLHIPQTPTAALATNYITLLGHAIHINVNIKTSHLHIETRDVALALYLIHPSSHVTSAAGEPTPASEPADPKCVSNATSTILNGNDSHQRNDAQIAFQDLVHTGLPTLFNRRLLPLSPSARLPVPVFHHHTSHPAEASKTFPYTWALFPRVASSPCTLPSSEIGDAASSLEISPKLPSVPHACI